MALDRMAGSREPKRVPGESASDETTDERPTIASVTSVVASPGVTSAASVSATASAIVQQRHTQSVVEPALTFRPDECATATTRR